MEELILKEQKFKEDLVNLVNGCDLPAFIKENVLRDLLEKVNIQKQLQYKRAMKKVELKPENKEETASEKD